MLAVLAAALLTYAVLQLLRLFGGAAPEFGPALLGAVGYTVIALAVFEVAKYVLEEEVLNPSERRYTGEARRGLTKFITTIIIAVFLEALVMVFVTGSGDDRSELLYPTLLLLAGVALVVGLGVYQRLSAEAEKTIGGVRGEAEAEALTQAHVEARSGEAVELGKGLNT